MPFRARTLRREFTTALAVVAVYVLVLLAPLHQAAGLQKDLAELGYGSPATWSICAAAMPDKGDDRSAADIKCPAAGIGKDELAAIDPGVIDLEVVRLGETTVYAGEHRHAGSSLVPHIAQARAPPATA